jgi:hypothetical protein
VNRGFAAWMGAACPRCGLPALLHGANCEQEQKLLADVLESDPLTGTRSPAGGARHAPHFTDKEKY